MRKRILLYMSLFLCMFFALFLFSGRLMAQEKRTDKEASAQQDVEKEKVMEKIKKEQEEVAVGTHFTYDPEGRRDPFVSVLEEFWYKKKGPRPKGIAGMLISEIDLVGIADDPAGEIAFFSGSDNKGYFLRIGDEVYDGKLIKIDSEAGTVTFRQQMDDPRLIKPYRDVIKRLRPLEEEIK